jgi:hypothetical protein
MITTIFIIAATILFAALSFIWNGKDDYMNLFIKVIFFCMAVFGIYLVVRL